nr:hypothetical protein [Tanacetum cinerariifolium]
MLSALRRSGNENKQACLVPAKSSSYCQAFNVKLLYGEIASPKKSQVKLKGVVSVWVTVGMEAVGIDGSGIEEVVCCDDVASGEGV